MIDFDRRGLFFLIKSFLGFVFLLLLTGFFSNIIFGGIYSNNDSALELTKKELNRIYSNRSFKMQNLTSLLDSSRQNQIVLGFVGDIMLDRGVRKSVLQNGNGDFRFIFQKIINDLKNYNILFGNLEGSISDQGEDQGSLYSFRPETKAIDSLIYAGFDVLSLANNHSGDWGLDALLDTINRLKIAGIEPIGADALKERAYLPKIIDIDGTKIAFLAFTAVKGIYEGDNIAFAHESEIQRNIKIAKKDADIVVVSLHFGEEYKSIPEQSKEKLAHFVIDSGADLLIGHHPHVVQMVEKYKNGYIAYSLGNFVFDQDFSEDTMHGMLLSVILKDKKILKIEPRDILINSFFQPVL